MRNLGHCYKISVTLVVVLNTNFKLKYYLKGCKYWGIFFPKSVCTEMWMQLHLVYLLYCSPSFPGIQAKNCNGWSTKECNEIHKLFKYFLNLLRIVDTSKYSKYEKGNKSFLFAVVAPWNFPAQQKRHWICPSLKENKKAHSPQKNPPQSPFLTCSAAYIYLNHSFIYDLMVLAVKMTLI